MSETLKVESRELRGKRNNRRLRASGMIPAVLYGHGQEPVSLAVPNPLPPGTTIGAIVRGKEVLMAHHDTEILAEDHVIIFVIDKRIVPKVEKLFQVAARFL